MTTKALPLLPLLLTLVGLPMAFGVVPPNSVYGVRTAHTLASPSTWYIANSWAGVTAVVLGLTGAAFITVLSRSQSVSNVVKIRATVGTTLLIAFSMAVAGLVSA